MVTSVVVRGPADILAMIPALLGFEPTRSIVIVARRGALQSAAMRLDLPRDDSVTTRKRFATSVVGMLCKVPDVESVMVAVFSDRAADPELPHAGFVDMLLRRIHQSGIHIVEAVCRAENAWGSYLDDEVPRGRPLGELEPAITRMAASMPVARAGEAAVTVTPEQRAEAQRRVATLGAVLEEVRLSLRADADLDEAGGEVPPELEPLLDLPSTFEEALEWDDAELRERAPILIIALQGPPVRDNAMLQWAFSSELGYLLEAESTRYACDGLDLENPVSQMLGDLMMGRGPRPDVVRVERAMRILSTLLALAEESQHPPLLCMLGWLSWVLGGSSRCAEYVERVDRIAPGYGMAEVLATLVGHGVLPEWLFERPEERGGG